jgi:hypothetical protein
VFQLKARRLPLLHARDKTPFELTPILLRLTRYNEIRFVRCAAFHGSEFGTVRAVAWRSTMSQADRIGNSPRSAPRTLLRQNYPL